MLKFRLSSTLTKNLKTNFTFRSLSENEREQAVHFIEYREIECTALMEELLSGAENLFVLENNQNKKFCALFYIRNESTLLHFIPFLTEEKNPDYNFSLEQLKEIRELVTKFILSKKIFCVYGEHFGTEYIKAILTSNGKDLIAANDYILMRNDLTSEIFSDDIRVKDNWKNLNVRKCSLEDSSNLMELERGYRNEEISVLEHRESDMVIKFVLNKALSAQIIFGAYIFDKGKLRAVAKAATNGRGKNFYQIGGVYCDKDFRNNGIANYVMQHLLRFIKAEGKNANLFVKVKNEPAKKLYANLGFVPVGKYQISYFQK